MKKIIYIISGINKAVAFEWIEQELKQEFDLTFILLNPGDSELERYLISNGSSVISLKLLSKRDYINVLIRLSKMLRELKPNVVHTHLFDANFLGLLSAFLLRIPKRIYTRHHSTFHHQYFPHAVKWDRMINWLATDIIAISENVRQVLIEKEFVKPSKVKLIHHGFKLEEFQNIANPRVDKLREKYDLRKEDYIIGVIARYLHLKGYQYIIPAFREILKEKTNVVLVVANAIGPDSHMIKELFEQQLPEKSYVEIKFESDIFALYKLFDVFIHVPINREVEAFGQIYVEALAAGVPSVFTLSGIAPEFIENGKNALVVPFEDKAALARAITKALVSTDLRQSLIKNGLESIQSFTIKKYIAKLTALYEA